jgi:hypothetical protein
VSSAIVHASRMRNGGGRLANRDFATSGRFKGTSAANRG